MPINSVPSLRTSHAKTWISGTFAVLLSVNAAASAAQAATATWSSETVLAADFAFSESASRIITAVNTAGRSAVAWEKPLPTTGITGGKYQIYGSVRVTTADAWSVPAPLSPDTISAFNAGVVVDPVTGKVSVAWMSADGNFLSSSSDGGITWVTSQIPTDPGYNLEAGANLIDTDGKGNVTIIVSKLRPGTSLYDVEAIVRTAGGTWRAPVVLTRTAGVSRVGAPNLEVLSDGRALLSIGTASFRRGSSGTWALPQSVDVSAFDVVDMASADMDANGRGYFVIHTITAGVIGVYVSTSTHTGGWSAPRHVGTMDTIYSALQITGSSSGRALISGADSSLQIRVTATSNGGSTWGSPVNLGLGFEPSASGSESGLYAVAYVVAGTGGYGAWIASGSGIGSAPWTQQAVGTYVLRDTPTVAIAGKSGSNTARAVGAWERQGDPAYPSNGVGAATATINR